RQHERLMEEGRLLSGAARIGVRALRCWTDADSCFDAEVSNGRGGAGVARRKAEQAAAGASRWRKGPGKLRNVAGSRGGRASRRKQRLRTTSGPSKFPRKDFVLRERTMFFR